MNEVKKLVEQLNVYRNAYYNENESLISDKEYDELFDKLVELEEKTGIIYANSPTQTVGYPVLSKLDKVILDHPLMSLKKTTEMDEFKEYFHDRLMLMMAKLDGLTISIHYSNGQLQIAKSRGNGEVGEDVTHTVRTFVNVPLEIPFKGEFYVDGEAIIDYPTFHEINKPLIEKATKEATEKGLTGKDFDKYVKDNSYKNPRNLVSGSVRQLNSEIAANRKIKFIAWKLYKKVGLDSERESNSNADNFKELANLGFTVVPFAVCNSVDTQAEMVAETLKGQCEKAGIPIDGIVGMFDDIAYGNNLGMTGHHPKHSLAYKFYQERNETTLLDIEWSTSRTGLINPVAIVEPVEIDGTTVSRATLSNVSIIEEMKLGIGDTVTIIKANQIIPKIMENLTESGTYKIPLVCPECHHPSEIRMLSDRKMLYCTNPKCPARLHDKMANFCNREGMNIVGLSDERLRTLMGIGYITDFRSIYELHTHQSELEKLDGFGKSSVSKLLNYIEESKVCKFSNVLTAIGIPGVGKSTAKSLAKYCASIKQGGIFQSFITFACNDYDWSQLSDFGELTSRNMNTYIKENRDEIEALVSILNVVDDSVDAVSNNKLGGKTFCITGKLIHFGNRDELVEEIEKYGGKIVSSVTSKTDYLITNDKDTGSSKLQKATKLGTAIITEEEFINLCK